MKKVLGMIKLPPLTKAASPADAGQRYLRNLEEGCYWASLASHSLKYSAESVLLRIRVRRSKLSLPRSLRKRAGVLVHASSQENEPTT